MALERPIYFNADITIHIAVDHLCVCVMCAGVCVCVLCVCVVCVRVRACCVCTVCVVCVRVCVRARASNKSHDHPLSTSRHIHTSHIIIEKHDTRHIVIYKNKSHHHRG